jgi:hypothetical protein
MRTNLDFPITATRQVTLGGMLSFLRRALLLITNKINGENHVILASYGNSECKAFSALLPDLQRDF